LGVKNPDTGVAPADAVRCKGRTLPNTLLFLCDKPEARPRTVWHRLRNRALVPIRAQVERTFGTRTRNSGWRCARSRGRARTGAHQGLPRAAKTLRRAASFPASANSFRPILGAGRGGG
jgi:hypothetical protein